LVKSASDKNFTLASVVHSVVEVIQAADEMDQAAQDDRDVQNVVTVEVAVKAAVRIRAFWPSNGVQARSQEVKHARNAKVAGMSPKLDRKKPLEQTRVQDRYYIAKAEPNKHHRSGGPMFGLFKMGMENGHQNRDGKCPEQAVVSQSQVRKAVERKMGTEHAVT